MPSDPTRPSGRARLWRQFQRFVVVGVIATVIHYSVLITAVELGGSSPVPASGLGFALSAGVNYVLNRRFTFESDAAHGRSMLRFGIVLLAGLGWNLLLMQLFTVRLEYPYLPAQVLTTGLVLMWNFGGNALWSFAAHESERGKP